MYRNRSAERERERGRGREMGNGKWEGTCAAAPHLEQVISHCRSKV